MYFLLYKKKPKRKTSGYPHVVRDLSPHTSQQGNPGLIPIEEEKIKTNFRQYKNHKCIRVKIFKIKLMACKNQGLTTTF